MNNRYSSLTEKNGARAQQAVKKWSRLLENTTKYEPIKTRQAKQTTAMLLENQFRALNEAATNSSILGPANGATGGALQTGDNYAQGDFRLPRILIPMVRRIYPALMSNEIVGVQPMPGPIALGFALRYKYLKGALHQGDTGTKHVHTTADATSEAKGQRGVETLISYTGGATVTVGNGNAPVQMVAVYNTAPVAATGQFVATVSQFVQSLVGPVVDKATTKPAYGLGVDATAAIAALKAVVAVDATGADSTVDAIVVDKLTLLDGQTIVGISMPNDDTNEAIHGGPSNGGLGNTEMGYQRLDTRYTGRSDERLAQPMAGGRWRFRPEDTGIAAMMAQFEDTGAVARTSFGFEKKSVEAGTRRLATSWTLETQEDLKNTNGIDIEDEATQQMSFELQAEIDREVNVRCIYSALSNGEWSLWDGSLADARWAGERGRAFYMNVLKRSARMEVRNRRGPANFIICTPDVAVLFESLDEFVMMPVNSSVSTSSMASAKLGTVGRFTVYCDTRTSVYDTDDYGAGYQDMYDPTYEDGTSTEDAKLPNYCLLGFKGAENWDAGIVYCPYIPIMVQKAVDPYSFSPNVGLFTRYGMLDNIFGAHLYYHMIIVDNFSQAGRDKDANNMYPPGSIAPINGNVDPYTGYSFPVHQTAGGVAPTP